MAGSISFLIDSPLRTLALSMSGLDKDVRVQIGRATKAAAQPIWQESTMANAMTRQESRLAKSAKVGVTTRNVFMRAGGTGKIGATPLSRLALAVEFGAHPDTLVKSKSGKGTPYERRMGRAFRLPRARGYVAYPASSEAIPRLASLWVQTAVRSVHEAIEKAT